MFSVTRCNPTFSNIIVTTKRKNGHICNIKSLKVFFIKREMQDFSHLHSLFIGWTHSSYTGIKMN